MSKRSNNKEYPKSFIDKLRSDDPTYSFIRFLLLVLVITGIFGGILLGLSGTWPSVVVIESGSMEPNMNIGDIVFITDVNRFGSLLSSEDAKSVDKQCFNGYGDVIVYHPNGNTTVTPIIHRVLYKFNNTSSNANKEKLFDYLVHGKYITTDMMRYISSSLVHAGYITKGDNNTRIDQGSTFVHSNVGDAITPIKDEWIVGKALFRIPYIGYIPLKCKPLIFLAIILLIGYEFYRSRRNSGNDQSK